MTGYATIREVSDHFGLPVSTLHYWERRGLIHPLRRSVQRMYDVEHVYRIALIELCSRAGKLSLDDISTLLQSNDDWRSVVLKHIDDIDAQLEELNAARAYLSGLVDCRNGPDLVQCPHFRASVSVPSCLTAGG